MKKLLCIVMALFMVGCSSSKEETKVDVIENEKEVIEGNGNLYQDYSEIPLLTDDSYLDFYHIYHTDDMEDNHYELLITDYYTLDNTIIKAEYSSSDDVSVTIRTILFDNDTGEKLCETFIKRYYDFVNTDDESFWMDKDEKGNVIGIAFSAHSFGKHPPYILESYYDIAKDTFTIDSNGLSDSYPDGGEEKILAFINNLKEENVDAKKLLKELDGELYFHDATDYYDYYLGPNSLKIDFMSKDIDEDGRTYLYGYQENGNDAKAYIDDDNKIVELVLGAKVINYEYNDEYVTASYYKNGKKDDPIIYKYDYNRNQISE